jgi:glycosyltransferase involved in cell wall biosynthesis
MNDEKSHISVCICTYKRPQFLRRLLRELADQQTDGLFTYSIVVVDNDDLQSAKCAVAEFGQTSGIPIEYYVESQQNIPRARNRSIENAKGNYVAFIDDDEFPIKNWLLILFKACDDCGVDGVLGPVKRHFDEQPPNWVLKGNFYERSTFPTGTVLDWKNGRTGNVLLKKHIFARGEQPFRPEFRASEDQDFFHRMIEKGHRFIWCDEALAYEIVPPTRWKRTIMLRRALLRGAMARLQPTFGVFDATKSVLAVMVYTVALPFVALLGQHRFMDLLIRLCDHLGKLLAVVGIQAVKEPYVVE